MAGDCDSCRPNTSLPLGMDSLKFIGEPRRQVGRDGVQDYGSLKRSQFLDKGKEPFQCAL